MSILREKAVIPEHFKLDLQPLAAAEAVVQAGHARFTVLTDRLIRLEYHPDDRFEDRASQAFWFRAQPVPEFRAASHRRYGRDRNGLPASCAISSAATGSRAETLSITLKNSGRDLASGRSGL